MAEGEDGREHEHLRGREEEGLQWLVAPCRPEGLHAISFSAPSLFEQSKHETTTRSSSIFP